MNYLRTIKAWYPFKKNSRILNLKASECTSQAEGVRGELFDYILLVLDRQQADLSHLKEFLAPGGRLLVQFQNRFSLRYLCGAVDEEQKEPFANLNSGSRLWSRQTAKRRLEAEGFYILRDYYILPDDEFPQLILTDEGMPKDSIRDRLLPFDLYKSPLIASEREMYDVMLHEGMLPYVADTYLLECVTDMSEKEIEPYVIYAALSLDRPAESTAVTQIMSDDTVRKISGDSEKNTSLHAIHDNLGKLKARGILTVPCEFRDDELVMPFIHEQPLMERIRDLLHRDQEAVVHIFEELYGNILKSSALAASERCAEEFGSLSDDSPILREGMIDMIPYNAFWSSKGIRYYDQEFIVFNCPAKYILFRAIFYTWHHIIEAEDYLPRNKMFQHFGLEKTWELYEMREMNFIENLRQIGEFRKYHNGEADNWKAMQRRRRLLKAVGSVKTLTELEQLI